MDWRDPTAVAQIIDTFSDGVSDDVPLPQKYQLPHQEFDLPGDDIELRTLAGLQRLGRDGQQERLLRRYEAILQFGHPTPEARRFLHTRIAEIERAQQQVVREALETLPAVATSNGESSVELQVPKIAQKYVERGDGAATVRFGYRLGSVRGAQLNLPVEAEAAALLNTLSRTIEIWKDRLSLAVEVDLVWRYFSRGGYIGLELLVDVEAPEMSIAVEAAAGIQDVYTQHFPFPEVYHFEPITEVQDLSVLSTETSFRSMAEIVRQEITGQIDGSTHYAVLPVEVDSDRLRDLLRYLRDAPEGDLVEIRVRPTRLTSNEFEKAMQAIARGTETPDPEAEVHPIQMGTQENPMDPRWKETLSAYQNMLAHLYHQAFEVHIRAASTWNRDILPLATLAGRALLGLGSFEVVPTPYDKDEARLRDFSPHSLAPTGVERLRYLWSRNETAVATRIPRPTLHGLPGVPLAVLKPQRIPTDLSQNGNVIGHVFTGNANRTLVRLEDKDRTRHVYLVGRTGTGKTTLMHNMALQDIEEGKGVGVIDPHGDLIDSLIARIPPERVQDVVVFEPSDVQRPFGLNMLDVTGAVAQNMAIADFIGLMYTLYDPKKTGIVGPRFEQSVRNSMHTAMALPEATIIDVLRIIGDDKYGKEAQKHLKDPVIKDYWETIYRGQSDFHRSEVKDYITSKFSRFTSDTLVRQIIGQPKTSINFSDIFNQKKILLVNLAKGKIGEFNSQFLGFILVSQLLIAAFQQADRHVHDRTPFHLFIDEFQNFATPGLATMLSEGRKYGLALTLANQFTNQLEPDMREAVFGNVGTICAFQVGLQDADYLSREMYPVFGTDDLVNMPSYHAAVKILVKSRTMMPFVLQTLPELRQPQSAVAEAVRNYSRMTYGGNAAVVADKIRDQFMLQLSERVKG